MTYILRVKYRYVYLELKKFRYFTYLEIWFRVITIRHVVSVEETIQAIAGHDLIIALKLFIRIHICDIFVPNV